MRLVTAVLGFLLRKVGVLAVLVLSLFLGYLLIQAVVPAFREAMSEQDRLEKVVEDRKALEKELTQLKSKSAEAQSKAIGSLETRVASEVSKGRQSVADKKADLKRLRANPDVCDRVKEVIDWVTRGNKCAAAEKAIKQADAALKKAESSFDQAEKNAAILRDPDLTTQEKLARLGAGGEQSVVAREISDKESQLEQTQTEEQRLEEEQSSGVGWVVAQWSRTWKWFLVIAVMVLVLPVAVRTLSYFVLMPLVNRVHRPIHLAAGSDTSRTTIQHTEAQRTLTIQLGDGEVLSARSEHVRPVQGKIRSRLLYDWSSPFISFAAGLYGLSRITGDEQVTSAVLSTPEDPDSYLVRIDFADHPGVVMRPRHVVGVIGEPELETRWRWGIQAFATWQVRYIMFAGTGGLIVQGSGDVVSTSPEGRFMRIEQNLLMGFDSRMDVGVNRTEVFWPYLWGKTPLVDDEFSGDHPFFWQKSSADGSRNPITKTFDALFSALGKLFGF